MSDKKGNKYNLVHADRTKKRKFRGNQYTVEQNTNYTSTSAKKLLGSKNVEVPISSSFAYCILEFATVFSTISSIVICKECKSDITFTQSSLRGLGFKICLTCKCDTTQLINSCPMIDNACEINRRFVFVMRLLGVGHEGVNLFCSLMDICQGIGNSTYSKILENIYTAASAVFETVLSFAVTQEKESNKEVGKPEDELTVSGDGTWKKRGFSSLFGVSTLIGKYSGKVLDASVMSSFLWRMQLAENKKKY